MKENLMTLMDEVIAEDMEIIDEFVEEEVKPLMDYLKEQRKKALEKEYKEVLELEEDVK